MKSNDQEIKLNLQNNGWFSGPNLFAAWNSQLAHFFLSFDLQMSLVKMKQASITLRRSKRTVIKIHLLISCNCYSWNLK